jgi:hypothetical protein
MDAVVQVGGNLEQLGHTQPACQRFLIAASESGTSQARGRDIHGQFTGSFVIHPWSGPYRVLVKCGNEVKFTKEVNYRDFGTEPYNIGSIAL